MWGLKSQALHRNFFMSNGSLYCSEKALLETERVSIAYVNNLVDAPKEK